MVVDDPCYFNFHSLLRANRVTVVTVPITAEGPDVVELQRLFAEHRPRLYLTTGGLHNPTGAISSPAIVHRVLRLAEEYDVMILEDDTFADFEAEPSTRLAALDGFRRVVQVGSATKAVGAALRCGYIAARPDWIPQIVDLKLATTMGNSATGAAILHRVLTESGYRRHLDGLRRKLADAMGRTLQNMRRHGLVPWLEPRAGIYLWARLPDGHQRRRRRPLCADEESDVRAGTRVQRLGRIRAAACASMSPVAAIRTSTRSSTKPSRLLAARSRSSRRRMPRYKLTLEYDGAPFVGWQRQENGLSVQEVLETALFAMTGARVTAHGAGRTDAGVHALGQVAHVDLERDWEPFRLERGAQCARSSPSRGDCRRRASQRRFRRAPQRNRSPLSLSDRQSPRAAHLRARLSLAGETAPRRRGDARGGARADRQA